MGLNLNDLIFKKDSKELTTGAKIGAAALAAGATLLLTRKPRSGGGAAPIEAPIQQPPDLNTEVSDGGGKPKKSNTGLYIGIGVGAVVLIGTVVYFATKKK